MQSLSDSSYMILFYLLLLSSSQVIRSNHRNLAQIIDCTDYSTFGNWSYIIYDVDMKCYDSNPDKIKYDQSGNLLLRNGQQIYLASKEKVFSCDVACIACLGPSRSDCIECVSPTRGTRGYPSVADIVAKVTMDCTCRPGFVEKGNQHCNCADGKYQDIPTNSDDLWGCFDCPYIFQKCSYNSGNNVINAIFCRVGIGRTTDPNKRCGCETKYHENQPIAADCVPDCEKPCAKCQLGSNKLCSECFDGLMIYDSTLFTCTCPPKYYMSLTDYRCYACHETCQSCNGQSSANCLSCIISSQRLMQSGHCNCQPHFVINTQVNCVPCDWSCDTCHNVDSCTLCIDADNREIGDSKYCICKPSFAEDLNSSICVSCKYTCATCVYQFDTCTSCPLDSYRQLQDSQCKCKDYYYDVGVNVCDSCHFTCKQCDGPSDIDCTDCDNSFFRYLNNYQQCVCQSGYGYIDQYTLECQQCAKFCLTCNQFDECLTCHMNSNRIVNENNQCICDDGYYEFNSQIQCLKCHFTCETCNGEGNDNCLSCNYDKGRELKDTQCSCLQGYYEFYKICTPCYYTCLTCVNQFKDGCTSCPSSRRILNNNDSSQCVCKSIAQIDDGKSLECTDCHYTCQTCSGTQPTNCLTCYETQNLNQISRQIKFGICSCPQYWFDDGQSEICQKCHASCLSCFDTTNYGCIECSKLDFRVQLSNSCLCMDGYFEEINFQQKSCNKCHYSCETCAVEIKSCLTCPSGSLRTLKDDKSCSCPDTYPNDVEGNPKCQPCHFSCSNCTGLEINMCTICSDANNRVFAQSYCECKQSYYEIGFSECASCIDTCQNCKNKADYCTSCDPNQYRVLSGNTCICGTRLGTQYLSYYDNLLDPECVACHYSCFTCSGIEYNQCQNCSDQDFRDQQGSECVCKPKYIDNGEGMCMQCNYSCDTCQGTKYYCTSCPADSLRTLNIQSYSCECPLRYYDAGISLCQKCDINCESCQSDSKTCLSCVFGTNRIYNQLTYSCDCLSGYYDNGDGTCSICHFSCLQCSGPLKSDCTMCPDFTVTKRYLNSNFCICSDNYFDNHTNQVCQICSSTCFTCQDNRNTCTQCLGTQNRSLSGSSCNCISRLYDSGSDICQSCSIYCLECQNLPNLCTQCDPSLNRYLKQQKCECQDGFFDNQQLQCQPCHFSCQTCSDISTCTSCDSNNLRELINGQCVCRQGSIEQGVYLCAICDSRCLTCENQTQLCSSCAINQNRIQNGNFCLCKDGYFENFQLQCQQCDQNCLTCIQNSTKCISCISNKVVDSGQCVCQNGYYTDSDDNCQICSNQCLLCSQSQTHCLSCNMNRQLVNNKCLCLDGQYDDGQIQCQYCEYSCEACLGSANNCISCSQLSKRYLSGSECLCQTGYYDIGSHVCQQCHYSCLTCQGDFTNCLTCENNRELYLSQCKCKAGYFDNGSSCAQCDVQCLTCTESSNKCTSCESNTFRDDQSLNFNKCPCQKGFYDDSTKVCLQCSYQCINCIGSATNCTACNNNPGHYRVNLLPLCNCQDGYYDDGIQVTCQKCDSSCITCVTQSSNCLRCESPRTRTSTPECGCREGYYPDDQKCQKCSIQCQTCSVSDICITCKPDRVLKNKTQCLCQDGYYEAKQLLCQLCNHKCSTCQDDALNCLVCAQDRINPPNCVCKDHYYDDYINNECQKCNQYCGKCDFNGCIDCAANRIQQGKTCLCSTESVSYLDTPWCSDCDVAVVKGIFSDDLTKIQYKFEYLLQFYFTTQVDIQQYCQKIISPQSLLMLGQSPQCSILDDILIIQLGDGSTVVVGDSIIFSNPPDLKHTNCQNQLTMILRTTINQPINTIRPSIQLDYPILPISPCSLVSINIVKQFVSGQRNLKIKWQSSFSLVDINQANEFQFQTLTIEQGALPENTNINITIQYSNFLNQQGVSQITIKTLSSSTPQLYFQTTKKQYFSWQPIKLLLYYSNQVCSDKYQQTLSDDIVIEFSEIIQFRNPQISNQIEFTQTKFNLNDSERIISTTIPARQLSINSNYSIQALYQDLINGNNLTTQFQLQIQKSPLIVQIVGGTRIVNYMKPFTIQVQAKDPDYQTEWNTDPDIQFQVTCIDIQHNNQPCKDIYNKTIPLNVTSDIQYIKQKRFNPFSVIMFKAVCKKQDLVSSDQVSIILLDIDLPTLNVTYPIGYMIRDVNINEHLQFQIQLNNNQLIKNMDFSYALVYDYELVYVKFIPTQSLKFAIWDNFNNFNFINKIFVKLQAHDLNYLMPQICSIQLSVNMPPVMSIVTVKPQLGNAFFTNYKVRVQNSKDTDSPIQYRFAYYQSQLLFDNDILKGRQDNLIILQDFSSQQTFTGILESGNLTLMISIQDSLGSTINYTQQMVSLSFNKQLHSQVDCLQFVQQFTNQTYDYKQSIVLSQELIKLLDTNIQAECRKQIHTLLTIYQQNLYIQLQLQTNLNVQTRISNILGLFENVNQRNSRRFTQTTNNTCLDSDGQIKFDESLLILNQSEPSTLEQNLLVLFIQGNRAIQQNAILTEDYQNTINIADDSTYRSLQQNIILRKSLIRVLGSLYQQAFESRFFIRTLINNLTDSFKLNLEVDQPGVKMNSDSVGVQTSKIGQLSFQKFVTMEKQDEEYLDLSNFQINRFIQISKYFNNVFLYSENFTSQFKNGSYKIEEIDNQNKYYLKSIILTDYLLYDPFIYVDNKNQLVQVEQIYKGKLAFNMEQKLNQCNTEQYNQSISKYSLVCSIYIHNEWNFDQCQIDYQVNDDGKIGVICYCSKVGAITLMIQNITNFNRTIIVNYTLDISQYIIIYLNLNLFNIIIVSCITILFIVMLLYKRTRIIINLDDTKSSQMSMLTDQPQSLTQQPKMSKQLLKRNLKYLHEILRVVTTRYIYLPLFPRVLLITFNISVSLTILHLLNAILGKYIISITISQIGSLLLQFMTKILEGFFNGPKALKYIGYVLIHLLIMGLFIINTIFITSNNVYEIICAIITLVILYGPIEILIQCIRLSLAFKMYDQLKQEPFNPIINFVYYFVQDEVITILIKGGIIE